MSIPNFKILHVDAVVPAKSVTEIYCEGNWTERKEWTNKENNKQEEADAYLHDTTNHIQLLYKLVNKLIRRNL